MGTAYTGFFLGGILSFTVDITFLVVFRQRTRKSDSKDYRVGCTQVENKIVLKLTETIERDN